MITTAPTQLTILTIAMAEAGRKLDAHLGGAAIYSRAGARGRSEQGAAWRATLAQLQAARNAAEAAVATEVNGRPDLVCTCPECA